MFHWICPECGREIPPAVKNCSVCEPAVAGPSQSQDLEAPAPTNASALDRQDAVPAVLVPQVLAPEVLVSEVLVPEVLAGKVPVTAALVPALPVPEVPVPETLAPPIQAVPAPTFSVEATPEIAPVRALSVPTVPAPEHPIPVPPAPGVPIREELVPALLAPAEPVSEVPVPEHPITAAPVTEHPIAAVPVPEVRVSEELVPAVLVPAAAVPDELIATMLSPTAPVAEPVGEDLTHAVPAAESADGVALALPPGLPESLTQSNPPELLTAPLPLQLPLSFEPAQGVVDPDRGLAMLASPAPAPLPPPLQESLQAPSTPESGILPPWLPAAAGTEDLENPLHALAMGVDNEQEIGPPPLPPASGLAIAAEPMSSETIAPETHAIPQPTAAPEPVLAGPKRPSNEPRQQPVLPPSLTPVAPFPAVIPVGATLLDALLSSGARAGVSAPSAEFAPPAVTTRMQDAEALTPRAVAPALIALAKSVLPEEAIPPGAGARPRNELLHPALGFGWLQDYKAAASRSMRPSAPAQRPMQANTSARMTLPGPTLPAELLSLSHAGLSAIPGYPRRAASSGLPGWLVSLSVMALVLVGGVGLLSYFVPNLMSNSAASVGPGDGRVTDLRTEVRASAYPLAKFVEVTGFRFVVDLNRKSEIHYLVVNHSGAELTGVNIFVTLRAAGSKPGQAPLCRFSFRAPEMNPFESKEMTSSIDKLTRTVALPDWQDLRADVEIGQ